MNLPPVPSNAVSPPPDDFNIAGHLLALNTHRPARPAYIDDTGTLTYGMLDERVRRMASGLRDLGIKREERVLLLMQDTNDWPVAFLGAIYAGIVPVPVNTLLTADDYAYMLEHSRAQAALVSGAVLPALKAALTRSDHEVHRVIVSHPTAPLDFGEVAFDAFLDSRAPRARAAPTHADHPAFWLYSSGSTGRPKGAVHSHANPVLDRGTLRQSHSRPDRGRCLLLRRETFFRLWAGQRPDLPAQRRRDDAADGRTRDSRGDLPPLDRRHRRHAANGVLRRPDRFRRHAGLAVAAQPRRCRVAPGVLGRRGAARRDRRALRAAFRRGHRRWHRLDRDAAHLHVQPPRPGALWHHRLAGARLRNRTARRGWPCRAGRRTRRPVYPRPVRRDDVLGNRARTRETFQGGWTKSGDKYVRNADGTYTYAGRSDDMLKVSGIWVSPFEVEATLVQHHAVLEAAVIGLPDTEGLVKTKAFVVLKPGEHVTDADLKAFVKDRLAPYKYPRAIVFVDELPKTATGKVQRFRLRDVERLANDAAPARATPADIPLPVAG